jgi:hypothetical protein
VIGVALDLGRPAFVAAHQQSGGVAAQRHSGSEKQRDAGHQRVGLVHVWNNFFLWRCQRAAGQAGHRHRGAHHLQEAAPAERSLPDIGALREFVAQQILEIGRLSQFL